MEALVEQRLRYHFRPELGIGKSPDFFKEPVAPEKILEMLRVKIFREKRNLMTRLFTGEHRVDRNPFTSTHDGHSWVNNQDLHTNLTFLCNNGRGDSLKIIALATDRANAKH